MDRPQRPWQCRPLLGTSPRRPSRGPVGWVLASLLALASSGCSSAASPADAGPAGPLDAIKLVATVNNPALGGVVDVVRDEWGIPHIYGQRVADVAFAQGYTMAMDRLVQMDLARHQGDGTLAELVGGLFPSTINGDIQMRVHHLHATAQAAWDELTASADPGDRTLVAMLHSFVAGINAYVADLNAGKYDFPPLFILVYDPKTFRPWTEVDTLTLGQLQAFSLAFDASSEILHSQILAAADASFGQSANPDRSARRQIGKDLMVLTPVDPTHTIHGWTGMNGDTSTAALPPPADGNLLALLAADHPTVHGIGDDRLLHPSRGSNNWIIGPQLSASGHTLVANDTHLSLGNPATFYLVHLNTMGGDVPVNVMGVSFPGIIGVILGNNEHIAWGATVNNIDVTDVYQETIVPCTADAQKPCAVSGGKQVMLMPRTEVINVGKYGAFKDADKITVTLYDVPGHGPVIPRLTDQHAVEALGSIELSIRYTGYDKAQLLRAEWGLDLASNMKEAVAALDRDFEYGGQNWVIGDDAGNFGWTQTIRVPRRAAGHAPWLVLPGDGTAEWGNDMDPHFIPHAYNPEAGYLATANADPIGVTDDGDPFFDEPIVDDPGVGKSPLYLGADYDPGTRVGRISKRIEAGKASSGKLSLDDLQAIQADALSEYGQALQPTLAAAAKAVGEELATPGTHPDLTAIAAAFDAKARAALPVAGDALAAWSFDTPSAVAEDNPSPASIKDSIAALVTEQWLGYLGQRALGDEIAVLGVDTDGAHKRKLLTMMCDRPAMLATGVSDVTHDALLFDDLATASVVESKLQMAALALGDALSALATRLGGDASAWRWGQVHTLTLEFPANVADLNVPNPRTDPSYPSGFPRHGGPGTVDVGGGGVNISDFTYSEGPAIRFVCELDPAGVRARNVLPGGEVFDPSSYHYRDQMELWRRNQTIDLAFHDADVRKSAGVEYERHAADVAHPAGRMRFSP